MRNVLLAIGLMVILFGGVVSITAQPVNPCEDNRDQLFQGYGALAQEVGQLRMDNRKLNRELVDMKGKAEKEKEKK